MDDFMEKVAEKIGEGDGVMGNTTYTITPKYSLVDDQVTKITFELKVTTERAHWSGGKPDANNKKAIQAAEALNKKHEEKHRKIAADICSKEFAKAIKDLKGKSEDDVQDAVDAIKAKIDKAYEDLDKKEGMTEYTEKDDGTFTVKQTGI
jgi:hypothetical protein